MTLWAATDVAKRDNAMIPKLKPTTRAIRVRSHGRRLYFGKADDLTARRIEKAAREQLARTGRATGVRTMRREANSEPHAGDFYLWMEEARFSVAEMSFEQNLMLAVLEDAKAQLGSRHADDVREATRWILSEDRSHVFAFVTICDTFGIDPVTARCALLARG